MNCCQCQGIEDTFNAKSVTKELAHYRANGPDKTTRMLIEALKAQGVKDAFLLDIGGGVGAVQHGLLAAGAKSVLDVDASQAYLHAAENEAARRGLQDRIRFLHGNFVDLSGLIPPADIVTLDRVVCCYHDMQQLVSLSAQRASELYALVYPRDTWLSKIGIKILNFFMWLQKNPFRTYIHATKDVEDLIRQNGLSRVYYRSTLIWQVVVFRRTSPAVMAA